MQAGNFVFGNSATSTILLSDDVLKEFSLSQVYSASLSCDILTDITRAFENRIW